LTYPNAAGEMAPFYQDETAAIHRRDPDAARTACTGGAEVLTKIMVSELTRRGVLAPPQRMAAL
jgi:hypothetical protein